MVQLRRFHIDVKRTSPFKNPTGNNKVSKGQILRLWYGEDLTHSTEHDNSGKSCADVYAEIEPDFKLQAKNVCFGAAGTKFGTFTVAKSGIMTAMKLVHKYGAVTCRREGHGSSNWGCGTDGLNTVVTTDADQVVFPKGANKKHGWYNLEGFTSMSKELVLSKPAGNNKVSKGQILRLWYGEDLTHSTEHDNSGKSCADVYAEIEPDFKLQAKNVCFGAAGTKFGTFTAAKSGIMTAIKLVHKYGAVTCRREGNGSSNWGCGTDGLNTVVTTDADKLVFPKGVDMKNDKGWYKLAGFHSRSIELVLLNPAGNNKVSKGQTLRLWYGEDLTHHNESNNSGKSCADVYAEI